MEPDHQYTVPLSATLLDAIEKIEFNQQRTVFVQQDGKLVGVISQGDIMRVLLRGTSVYDRLRPYVHPSFKFLRQRDLSRSLDLFRRHNISLIPIVDADMTLRDVVSIHDVLESVELR